MDKERLFVTTTVKTNKITFFKLVPSGWFSRFIKVLPRDVPAIPIGVSSTHEPQAMTFTHSRNLDS